MPLALPQSVGANPYGDPAPVKVPVKRSIAFTRIDGVPYAQLCAPVDVDEQDIYQSLIDTDPSKGWVDLEISTYTDGHTYAKGTRWRVGSLLPGQKVATGSETWDFSAGYYKIDLSYLVSPDLIDSPDGDVIGKFNAATLTNGEWVDANGNPEPSACADYSATS